MKHCYALCILLAVLSSPAAFAGDECAPPPPSAGSAATGVGVLAIDASGTVHPTCRDGSLVHLRVRLPASGQATAVLAVAGLLDAVVDSEDGRLSSWTRIEFDAAGPLGPAPVTLAFAIPADTEAGTRIAGRLQLRLDRGERESALAIPLVLEVAGEEPLFRDDFGVDPVIGQFSLVQ